MASKTEMRPRSTSDVAPRRQRLRYIYEPLKSPQHIRLLTLLHYDPTTYQVYARLNQFGLEHLSDRYTALSYTWNLPVEEFILLRACNPHPPSPHTIDLHILPQEAFETFKRFDDLARDGAMVDTYTTEVATIPVGQNLSDWFKAYLDGWPVKQMEKTNNPFEATTFWIDAICIDQGNEDEKATQIPLMGQVYSSASRVLSWLGADTTDLTTFRWWHEVVLQRLQGLLLQHHADDVLRMLRKANFTDASFWRDNAGLESAEETWSNCWTAYCAFYLSRRWFHRAWVVQEAVLAKKLHLQCGRFDLEWQALADFAYMLGKLGWLDALDTLAINRLPPQLTQKRSRGFGITDLYGLQRDDQGWHISTHGWPQSWWAMVSAVRRRNCFFPRDKVYATVGFLEQLLGDIESLPFAVAPNATTDEVFIKAATTLLLNWPQLTILSFVEPSFCRNIKQLPSWVPDLTVSQFGWPIGAFDSSFSAGVRQDNTLSSVPIVTASNDLEVRGFRISAIAKIYAYRLGPSASLYGTVLEVLADLPACYKHALGGQDRIAALVHTMTCMEASNPHRGTMEETARVAHDFHDWLLVGLGQIWLECRLEANDEKFDASRTDDWRTRKARVSQMLQSIGPYPLVPSFEELDQYATTIYATQLGKGDLPELWTSPQSFNDQIQRLMKYRYIFTTADGWLGMCRQDCREGDEVWILERGAVPYTLRPVKNGGDEQRYEFMGECYVHGAMHGELMSEDTESERLLVTVRIS